MDYKRHYDKLIERAKSRVIDGYKEKHHIMPKCLGGDDSKGNIVLLTAEEHFIAHKLLILIYPGNKKLIWAAIAMTNKTGRMSRNNKSYGWLRREFASMISTQFKGKKLSEERRKRISEIQTGKKRGPHSAETKLKMSLASKGRKKSDKHKEALSASKIGKKLGPHRAETRLKISLSNKTAERDLSFREDPEYKKRQSESMKLIWSKRKELKLNNI